MTLIALALLGAAVGGVHAVLAARVTLRHRLWPVLLGLGAFAVAAAIWFISVGLSPYGERLWWAFITGFAVASGVVGLVTQVRHRSPVQ